LDSFYLDFFSVELVPLDCLSFVGAGSAAGAVLEAEMTSGSSARPGARLPDGLPAEFSDPALPRRLCPGEV
jgi:hypothetical protein